MYQRCRSSFSPTLRTCPTFQHVKAKYLPPAGLLFPLPIRTLRGRCICQDFLELPISRSCHDFLQVHIDLLTRFKTAIAETAARNFVASPVFRDVRLSDVLV